MRIFRADLSCLFQAGLFPDNQYIIDKSESSVCIFCADALLGVDYGFTSENIDAGGFSAVAADDGAGLFIGDA